MVLVYYYAVNNIIIMNFGERETEKNTDKRAEKGFTGFATRSGEFYRFYIKGGTLSSMEVDELKIEIGHPGWQKLVSVKQDG